MATVLTINLLLLIAIELPIVGFFFRKRKRRGALLVAFFLNIAIWPIINILRFQTEWNVDVLHWIGALLEFIGYWQILKISWKKALLIAFIANLASFALIKVADIKPEMFEKKTIIIR
jgi:hypothetical protein